MKRDFARSRDRLATGLTALGWSVLPSAGTYFLTVDIGTAGAKDDVEFAEALVREHGVATIPVSAFYAEDAVTTAVRFCFAKHDATIDAALHRLSSLKLAA
jgi:aspartate/methionine/tyrosine aminotransferase